MPTRQEQLRAELEGARLQFHQRLAALGADAWRAPSRNPGWSNGELCFHMLLGFILVPPLLSIMRLMKRLPSWCDTGFARALDASTPLFNRVNALGPRVGARLLSPGGVGRQLDRAMNRIERRLARLRDADLDLGMRYPTRWDPTFEPLMTAERLIRYSIAHLRHHLAQLTVVDEGARETAPGHRA